MFLPQYIFEFLSYLYCTTIESLVIPILLRYAQKACFCYPLKVRNLIENCPSMLRISKKRVKSISWASAPDVVVHN